MDDDEDDEAFFNPPKVSVEPPPSQDEASERAAELAKRKNLSQEQFLRRQATLGPRQLQVPGLRL